MGKEGSVRIYPSVQFGSQCHSHFYIVGLSVFEITGLVSYFDSIFLVFLCSFSEFSSQTGVQVLLVDLASLLVPAVMSQQRHVPGRDGAHFHGAGCPLHGVEVVQPVVQDERRGLPVRRTVRGVSEPRGLGHGVVGEEHALQLLLGQ